MPLEALGYFGPVTRIGSADPAASSIDAGRAKVSAPPVYASALTSISPGSLASAYKLMRNLEQTGIAAAAQPAPDHAIVSAVGLKVAFSSYEEITADGMRKG